MPRERAPILASRAGRYTEVLPIVRLLPHFKCMWMSSASPTIQDPLLSFPPAVSISSGGKIGSAFGSKSPRTCAGLPCDLHVMLQVGQRESCMGTKARTRRTPREDPECRDKPHRL